MKNPWRLVAGPMLLAGLLYGSSVNHSFAWDDHYLVVNNPSLHSFENALDWFAHPWAAGSDSEGGRAQNALYWRPVTQLSYAIDWAIGRGTPGIFHASNVAFHMLCTALLVLLLCRLWEPLKLPANLRATGVLLAGFLFASHPVHTEAVHLITYRTTLLSSAGTLGALLLFMNGRRNWALIPFVLGLLSKEECIVTPALIVGLDWMTQQWPSRPKDWLKKYTGLLVVSILYLILHASLTSGAALNFFAGQESDTVFFTMMKVLTLDMKLMVWPWPLTPFYDWTIFPYAHHPFHGEVVIGMLALGAGMVYVIKQLSQKRHPGLAMGWYLFFLVSLIPYSHLIPFFDVAGERFLYLPSVAFCAGLPMVITKGSSSRFLIPLCGLLILVFCALTWTRGPAFQNTRTLLEATQSNFPNSFSAAYELGRAELKQRDFDKAETQFKRAFNALPLEVAGICAAQALVNQGKNEEARTYLRQIALNSRGEPRPGISRVLLDWGSEVPPSSLRCDEGNMLETSP